MAADPMGDVHLQGYDSLSPEALLIASGWADGTYDLAPAQARFDFTDFSFGLDTNYGWLSSAFSDNWIAS